MRTPHLERRSLLKTVGAVGIAAAIPAAAGCSQRDSSSGAITVRITHDEPATMLTHRLLSEMADRVAQKTDGDVTIEISPQLELSGGDIATMIQQVQSGARLDAGLVASGIYSSFDGAVDVFSLPFLCRDIDDLKAVAESSIGDDVKERTSATGLHTQDIWVRDLRQWVNAERDIRSPDDMRGLTFRVPEFPLWVAAFEAMGAAATPMPFGEAFTGVQTGAIDGAERPTEFLVGEGWDEVADYVTLSNYAGDVLMVSFNQQFWDGLPQDVRSVLDEELRVTGAQKHEQEKTQRGDFIAQLEAAGMTTHELTVDEYSGFRDAMDPVWEDWEGRLPEGWLQTAQQAVGS